MAGSLSPLKRWLHFVDEQLSTEAVEYLKLGLHSEFFSFYGDVQKLGKPSEIYYYLLEHCMRGSESKTLKMFAHVVRGLGGSLRGNHVHMEAFGVNCTFNVRDPGPFNLKKASANFKLFQCLLKIAVKARRTALCDQLKKKFSKSRFLNINHRLIKNLPELFIKLFQTKVIAANNTHHLVEALYKYKAWICLRVLDEYHKSVGLQPIVLAQGMEAYICATQDYLSSDPSSVDESSDNNWTSDRTSRPSYYVGTELEFIDENDPVIFSYRSTVAVNSSCKVDQKGQDSDQDSDASIDSSETDIMMKKEAAAKGQLSFGNNKILVLNSSGTKSNRKYKVGWLLLLVFLLVTICVSIVLIFKVWIPLKNPGTSLVSVLQNSKVVLTEVNSQFHQSVDLSWEITNLTADKSDVVINFYHAESSCEHVLETDMVWKHSLTTPLTSDNISSHTVYALKDSSFDYKISGNDSRVNFVIVCVYAGTSYGKGNQLLCRKVRLNGDSGYFHVTKSGYYFFKVETPVNSVNYLLSVTQNLIILNLNTQNLFDCEINSTNDRCPLALQQGREVCVMAEFYRSVYVSEVNLNVTVKNGNHGLMLIFPLSVVAFVVSVIILCMIVLACCCCARIRKLYRNSTVV